jgi:inositol transport system ATP-binding protein
MRLKMRKIENYFMGSEIMVSASDQYSLQMKGIVKRYPGVVALNGVDFHLKPGTVHVLMGENGAGKSTLMKILAGISKPDDGEIRLRGARIELNSPRDSLNKGIAMIHQELSPVPEMTISENLFLGRERLMGGVFIDYKKINQESEELLKKVGLKKDPRVQMKTLTVSETQMVEIAKAISYQSDIIIMDEPTSAITDREVERLFELIQDLKSKGKSIIYISHKMDEIFRIGDEITVLRDGNYVGTYPVGEITYDELIKKMVDRELKDVFPYQARIPGEERLRVKNLTSQPAFQNISFHVRSGEVLGIAGLMGSGRTEVVESIFGARKLSGGEIHIAGKPVRIRRPTDAMNHGIGLITEDRKLQGLVLERSIKENITLSSLGQFSRFSFIDRKKEGEHTKRYVESLRIKAPSIHETALSLSGGNQQKIVLAKWLMRSPDILIFDEPTRGIDIGAKTEIYRLIQELAEQGVAVILISSELPEILGLSDRILVFSDGRISGELSRKEATQESIMKLAMAGAAMKTGGKKDAVGQHS